MPLSSLELTPGVTACTISIHLAATPDGSEATIVYSHTSLGPEGDRLIAGFTEEYYERFMRDRETRLNHCLSTGEMLRGVAGR